MTRPRPARQWSLASAFQGTPWPEQAAVLPELQAALHEADVVVLDAPVGSGKTLIADALTRYACAKTGLGLVSAAMIAPNNILVKQYADSVRGLHWLHRADHYTCGRGGSCVDHKREVGAHCKSFGGPYAADACPYLRDLRSARGAGRLACNQHIYMAHKLRPSLAVFDEAHSLLDTIAESAGTRLWRSVHGWRRTFESVADVAEWLSSDVPRADIAADPRLQLVHDVLLGGRTDHSISLGEADYRGRDVEFVLCTPLDLRAAAGVWFPESIQKLVLMSATISPLDVAALGLDSRRVAYVRMASAIPPDRRPLIHIPIAPGTHANRTWAIERMAAALVDGILPEWPDDRGLIHAPYSVAAQLHALIGDHPRLMWIPRAGKSAALEEWLRGGGPRAAVAVASGVHEGLDLRDDVARFQVALCAPRPSMADPGWAWMARHEPARYEWATIRSMVQLYGRVSRHPLDFGVTYVLDSSAKRELSSSQIPSWVLPAVEFRA